MIVSRSRTVPPQLTPLTLDGTVLKESADLVILGVTFDAMMTFEKHLRSVSSAAAQRLGIMRKYPQVFHDWSLLLRSFWSVVLPVLEYCSALWCSAADSHLKLLDRVVRSAGFLAGGVLDCNLAHRRSVAELCMLFKINPMHPLRGALPLPYVPARVTRGALVAHSTRSRLCVLGLLSIAEPLCPSLRLFRTILVTLCLMVWDWRVSRAEPMLSCWHDLLFLFCLILFYLFLTSMGWLCGVGGLWIDRVLSISPVLAQRTPIDNNNNNRLLAAAAAASRYKCFSMQVASSSLWCSTTKDCTALQYNMTSYNTSHMSSHIPLNLHVLSCTHSTVDTSMSSTDDIHAAHTCYTYV